MSNISAHLFAFLHLLNINNTLGDCVSIVMHNSWVFKNYFPLPLLYYSGGGGGGGLLLHSRLVHLIKLSLMAPLHTDAWNEEKDQENNNKCTYG